MKRTKQRLGVYTVLLFFVLSATVTLKTLALLYNFDFATGYFEDKLLAGISDVLLTVGVLLSLSFVAVGRCEALRSSFSSPAFYLPSGLVGVGLLFFSAHYFKLSTNLILPFVVALLSLVSLGYFILGSFIEGRRDSTRAALGIIMALFLSVYAAYLYFDGTLPINAPTKVLDEMAYIFTSVFFLFEVRISLGRDKWGAYLALGMAAALLTAVSSLPALIVYFVRGITVNHSLSETVLTAALFVFTSARVLHSLSLRADRKCPLALFAEKSSEQKPLGAEAEESGDERDDGEPDNYTMTFDDGEAG